MTLPAEYGDLLNARNVMPSSLNDACRTIETLCGAIEKLVAERDSANAALELLAKNDGYWQARIRAAEQALATERERCAKAVELLRYFLPAAVADDAKKHAAAFLASVG